MCKQGNCLGAKLTNVFVSEDALEEHKQKFHKKYRSKVDDKPVMNIMFGFNKKEEDEYEWDKVGKNFES